MSEPEVTNTVDKSTSESVGDRESLDRASTRVQIDNERDSDLAADREIAPPKQVENTEKEHDFTIPTEILLEKAACDFARVFPTPSANPLLMEQHATLNGKLAYLRLKLAEQEKLRRDMQEEIIQLDSAIIPEIKSKTRSLERAFITIDMLDALITKIGRSVDALDEHISQVERQFQIHSLKKLIPFSRGGAVSPVAGLPAPPTEQNVVINIDEYFERLRQILHQHGAEKPSETQK